jgi:hypothetical protein
MEGCAYKSVSCALLQNDDNPGKEDYLLFGLQNADNTGKEDSLFGNECGNDEQVCMLSRLIPDHLCCYSYLGYIYSAFGDGLLPISDPCTSSFKLSQDALLVRQLLAEGMANLAKDNFLTFTERFDSTLEDVLASLDAIPSSENWGGMSEIITFLEATKLPVQARILSQKEGGLEYFTAKSCDDRRDWVAFGIHDGVHYDCAVLSTPDPRSHRYILVPWSRANKFEQHLRLLLQHRLSLSISHRATHDQLHALIDARAPFPIPVPVLAHET